MLLVVDMVCKKWGMAISVDKSKVLAVGRWRSDGTHLFEQPNPRRGGVLTYLGSSIDKSGKASAEVDIRIEKGGRAYQM